MERWIVGGAFLLVSVLTAVDMWVDYGQGTGAAHLMTEGAVMALGLLGLFLLAKQIVSLRREAVKLRESLRFSQEEAAKWKSENQQTLKGLGESIDAQFDRWQLTSAEKEIGLLLLKGFSLKEIAEIRKTSERTVRQQAGQIYQKSRVGGRAEFSAFFLEDLLLPIR